MSDPTVMPEGRSRSALSVLRGAAVAAAGAVGIVYLLLIAGLYFGQRGIQYPGWGVAEPVEASSLSALGITDVRIRAPDGETLAAWFAPPAAGRPVILYLHGNGGRLSDARWRYVRMHAAGVGFLALSYRGYGNSTGRPTEEGLFIDGLAAYDWLRAHGAAADDIVLHGHSLGSGVATYVATKRPVRALILEAPFTAAVDVAAELYWFIPVSWLMSDQYASRERIGDVHVPVLIAHGERDSVVPFEQGARLYTLANEPKTFVRIRGADHSTLTRDGVYQCYWKFLGLAYHAGDAARICAPL
jgi:fermentation-respiration switch protein FrsA (DUF1100 family)